MNRMKSANPGPEVTEGAPNLSQSWNGDIVCTMHGYDAAVIQKGAAATAGEVAAKAGSPR